MSEWLPAPNSSLFPPLRPGDARFLGPGTRFGRIYSTAGAYPGTWDEFRSYGPTLARFDHHPPPPRTHIDRGVLYAVPALPSTGTPPAVLKVCLAECYRATGSIDLTHGDPYFTVFTLVDSLRLLDLGDSDWVTRAGGNAAISSGRRSTAREWAQAIYDHYQSADAFDGLIYPSSNVPSHRCVVLWERAEHAIGPRPDFNEPLTHVGLRPALEKYAAEWMIPLLLP